MSGRAKLQPWARASPTCSWCVQPQLGPPSWSSLSYCTHAWPSRGDPALLPTFFFSHAAGGPPTALKQGLYLEGGQEQPLRAAWLPSWPSPLHPSNFCLCHNESSGFCLNFSLGMSQFLFVS